LKVLFVNPNINGLPYINFGIAYLSASLKAAGHETGLIDITFGYDRKKIFPQAKKFAPDIVCVSSKSTEYPTALEIAGMLKPLDVPMFCGGVHPTVAPLDVLSFFDGAAIGEGERSLLELVNRIESGKSYFDTPGYWFNNKGTIIKNDVLPLIENLDTLPHPDREIFDYAKYLEARDGEADFLLSRGCPFNCTYCINHRLQKLYRGKGRYTRFSSIPYAMEEIKAVIAKYKVTGIKFEDDTFNADHRRLADLCRTYKNEIGLPFECNLRADLCTQEMFSHLKNAGCRKVNIGVEAGSERIRKEVLHRNITDEQMINAFRWAKDAGIHTMSFNMVGLPYETRNDIYKTIELNKKMNSDSIQASVFVPFLGTELFELCQEKGWIDPEKTTTSYYTGTTTRYPHITQNELMQLRKRFPYYCYRDKSMAKASLLLLREYVTPLYLKYGDRMPVFVKRMIYRTIWHSKTFKFLSK
jgi:anaerobic magnesium-protoporphyrin IX monomethyl ester cyclase